MVDGRPLLQASVRRRHPQWLQSQDRSGQSCNGTKPGSRYLMGVELKRSLSSQRGNSDAHADATWPGISFILNRHLSHQQYR